jgi:hypothetical protein
MLRSPWWVTVTKNIGFYVFNYLNIYRTLTVVLQPTLMDLKVYSLKLSVLKISLSVLTKVLWTKLAHIKIQHVCACFRVTRRLLRYVSAGRYGHIMSMYNSLLLVGYQLRAYHLPVVGSVSWTNVTQICQVSLSRREREHFCAAVVVALPPSPLNSDTQLSQHCLIFVTGFL